VTSKTWVWEFRYKRTDVVDVDGTIAQVVLGTGRTLQAALTLVEQHLDRNMMVVAVKLIGPALIA
jgi:hypothetical protein